MQTALKKLIAFIDFAKEEKMCIIEGSLEVKLPTIWTDEKSTARKKQSQEETRTWRKSEGRRSEMEKVRREKMHMREKVASRETLRRVEK